MGKRIKDGSNGVHILIVEDSLTQAEKLKHILEQKHYHVDAAVNGKDALAFLKKSVPDLIISDILMPQMNGYEMCRKIKGDEKLKDIPVILLTSLSDPDDIIHGLECGADNFVVKPYDENYLLTRINHLLTNMELRKSDKVQMGVSIHFAGRNHVINSDRRQILDLLLSTFESAVQQCHELKKAKAEIEKMNEQLEEKVAERTAALTAEIAERKRAEEALRFLQSVILSVSTAKDLESALFILLRDVCGVTGWALGQAWIPSADKTVLECSPAWFAGEPGTNMEPFRKASEEKKFKSGEGLVGQVWMLREPVGLCDVLQDSHFLRKETALEIGLTSVLCVPVFAEEEVVAVLEFLMREPCGSEKAFMNIISAVASQLGSIIQRKKLEDEKKRLVAILETTTDLVATADVHGNVLYMNQSGRNMLGVEREEDVIQTRISDYHPPHVAKNIFEEGLPSASREGTWSGETVLIDRNGGEIPVSQVIMAHKDKNGNTKYFSTIMRDMTLQIEREDTLRESHRRLEEALASLAEAQQRVVQQERLHALGQMASGIAHDFNNALSPVIGFSELLLIPDALGDGEKTKRYLEMINTSAHDAAEIVKRLREFYRPRDENEEHYPANLKSIIEQVIAITQPKWKNQLLARGIIVQIETDFQVAPEMTCDEHEMREMFTNLIFNAVDAMPQGGTITIRSRMEKDALIVEVSDTGVGMTEEIRKRCFEPFFSTKGSEGTGLGLSMVYGIAQRHGGTLEIESEPGKGTTVRLRCPQKTSAPSDFNENKRQTAERPLRPLRVLVTDDEAAVRMVIAEYLSMDGHVVETACDGKEALEKFFAGYFDLVISDRSMPQMSGDQLALAVKNAKPEISFILLTGFGDLMNSAGESPEGVDLIVSKPVTRQALREAMLKVVSV